MTINIDDYKGSYIQAATALLNEIRQTLAKPDFQNDPRLVEELHRNTHSLKGQALAMGYNQIGYTGKMLESIFREMDENKMPINTELSGAISESIDAIEKNLSALSSGNKENDMQEIINNLTEKSGIQQAHQP